MLNPDFSQQFTVRFLGSTDVKEPRGSCVLLLGGNLFNVTFREGHDHKYHS